MKSLSCFCDDDACDHYNLGTLQYQTNAVFSDSEDDIPLTRVASTSRDWQEITKTNYVRGDYVLVKFIVGKKEYRYAAICTNYDDDDEEVTVAFLQVCNEDGTEFKLNNNDVSDVAYRDVIEKLPVPRLVIKNNFKFYIFNKPVNVYEK
nr:unnamed protein product [Callosobruchus chinensis]